MQLIMIHMLIKAMVRVLMKEVLFFGMMLKPQIVYIMMGAQY